MCMQRRAIRALACLARRVNRRASEVLMRMQTRGTMILGTLMLAGCAVGVAGGSSEADDLARHRRRDAGTADASTAGSDVVHADSPLDIARDTAVVPTGWYWFEHFDGAFDNAFWGSDLAGGTATRAFATSPWNQGLRVTDDAVPSPGNGTSNYGQMVSPAYANCSYAHAGLASADCAVGHGTPDEAWYRFRIHFPADYQPTPGTQNTVFEFHNDPTTVQDAIAHGTNAYSPAIGVQGQYPGSLTTLCAGTPMYCTTAGTVPAFFLQIPGGVNYPAVYRHVLPAGSLQLDHWYDMILHVVWDGAPNGHVQWWIDGALEVDLQTPTFYTRTDGTYSYMTSIGFYQYRLWADWPSTIDYDELVVGPTPASVGFAP
jgi:hypothetical protein